MEQRTTRSVEAADEQWLVDSFNAQRDPLCKVKEWIQPSTSMDRHACAARVAVYFSLERNVSLASGTRRTSFGFKFSLDVTKGGHNRD